MGLETRCLSRPPLFLSKSLPDNNLRFFVLRNKNKFPCCTHIALKAIFLSLSLFFLFLMGLDFQIAELGCLRDNLPLASPSYCLALTIWSKFSHSLVDVQIRYRLPRPTSSSCFQPKKKNAINST